MDYLVSERAKPPVTRRGIYWLASYPKSGNTWLRAFIGHLIGTIDNDPEVEKTREMLEKYTVDASHRIHFKTILSEQELASNSIAIFGARPHAQQLLATKFAHSGFAKTHSVALSVRGVAQINLGVTRGAAYVIRDPRDVAVSYAAYYGLSIDEAIKRMNLGTLVQAPDEASVSEVFSTWSAHVTSWVDSPIKPFVLRYEDMLERPLDAFTAFAHHASMPATPEQIERAIEFSSFSRLQGQENADGFDHRLSQLGRTFFRVGKAGQWRDTLSPAQIDRIVAEHGAVMQRFGYLPE
jgi:hypothetical protein